MTNRFQHSFRPINSTAPSFSATFDNTSAIFALESAGVREWEGPGSNTIRIGSLGSDDCHFAIGSSDLVVAAATNMLYQGGTIEVFSKTSPRDTHIVFVSSTDVTMNVSLGYGN